MSNQNVLVAESQSRWSTMSETTRIVTAVSAGLAALAFTVLLSIGMPELQAMCHKAILWGLEAFFSLGLTPENVVTAFLASLGVILLLQGIMFAICGHMHRIQLELTDSQKSFKAPQLLRDLWFWLSVTSITLATVALNLLDYNNDSGVQSTFSIALNLFAVIAVTWLALAVGALMLLSCLTNKPLLSFTAEQFVRTWAFSAGAVYLSHGYTMLNLGLFVGISVMAWLLVPLEPKSYND